MTRFAELHQQILSCTLCKDQLPLPPTPLVQMHPTAKILIAGQAPGLKAHNNNQLFSDKSGERLRIWMGLEEKIFYDSRKIAILPMAFCYPGRSKTGDNPPSKVCPKQWRESIHSKLKQIQLTLVIGQYAQEWYLPNKPNTLTETVKQWRSYPSNLLPLPHPSPRNNIWLAKNSWFAEELVPELQSRVQSILNKNKK